MEGVNYAPTQNINVMIEFLLIFLTNIPKHYIHHDKLNDMLAHVGLLTRKISILLEESSENNIDEADFQMWHMRQNMSLIAFLSEIKLSGISSSHFRLLLIRSSLQLEDKNGDDPLDAKFSIEPIESTSSSSVKSIWHPWTLNPRSATGHEEDEARIIGLLLDEHEYELDVISIIGMPGVGKTTLANKVYNNTLVASHFKIRAWCTVSQKYNKSKVLREILQQVIGSEEKGNEDHDLVEKLRRALLDKRYLIVLDDVWDIATGEMLIACFPKVERGNRVILTSRSSEVGLKVKCQSSSPSTFNNRK
ncbi:hypothetical protein KY289_019595 [Solanum tuberosum]|nr:hypothetical protein KY289_019595 [Solanum tuberosum]